MYINKLIIADDHELILAGLKDILLKSFNIETLLACSDPTDVLHEAEVQDCDLYILDLEYQQGSGIELINDIRRIHKDALIIVNTMHEEIWTVAQLIDMDINGVVLKSDSCSELVYAVKAALNGCVYYCPQFKDIIKRNPRYLEQCKKLKEALTDTELKVMNCIARGDTSKEIANATASGISENTIEWHRKNLLVKLEAKNMAHLTALAVIYGMVDTVAVKNAKQLRISAEE